MSGNGVVVFDYTLWSSQFPELAPSISGPQAQMYFDFATLTVDNCPTSVICDLGKRANILNMLTSHIAALLAPINGQPPRPIVGRISAATEGSVSVTTEMDSPQAASWFNQTPYGALAWQAMLSWRTALYIPNNSGPTSYPWGPVVMPFNGGFPWPAR